MKRSRPSASALFFEALLIVLGVFPGLLVNELLGHAPAPADP